MGDQYSSQYPRFVIRKLGGWSLIDKWLDCESQFNTWDEALLAAATAYSKFANTQTELGIPYHPGIDDLIIENETAD